MRKRTRQRKRKHAVGQRRVDQRTGASSEATTSLHLAHSPTSLLSCVVVFLVAFLTFTKPFIMGIVGSVVSSIGFLSSASPVTPIGRRFASQRMISGASVNRFFALYEKSLKAAGFALLIVALYMASCLFDFFRFHAAVWGTLFCLAIFALWRGSGVSVRLVFLVLVSCLFAAIIVSSVHKVNFSNGTYAALYPQAKLAARKFDPVFAFAATDAECLALYARYYHWMASSNLLISERRRFGDRDPWSPADEREVGIDASRAQNRFLVAWKTDLAVFPRGLQGDFKEYFDMQWAVNEKRISFFPKVEPSHTASLFVYHQPMWVANLSVGSKIMIWYGWAELANRTTVLAILGSVSVLAPYWAAREMSRYNQRYGGKTETNFLFFTTLSAVSLFLSLVGLIL